MLGIIICTHSTLSESFKQTAEMILGKQENFQAVGLFEGDSVINLSKKINKLIEDMNTDENLIFTDMFGASPSNAAAMSVFEVNACIITGVNLTMIVEALGMREQYNTMDELLSYLTEVGKGNIRVLTKDKILEA